MKIKHLILGLSLLATGLTPLSANTLRVWTDSQGRKVQAKFVKLEGENLTIELENGTVYNMPLSRLSAEDQALAKTLKPSETAVQMAALPANANPLQAAAKIDQLVEMGIQRANPKLAANHQKEAAEVAKNGVKLPPFRALAPNPLSTDEQFVRRIYLDVVGRIPKYEESLAFLKDRDPHKRTKLIDKLLMDDGYVSNMYNYMSDMLRVADKFQADFVRGLPYIQWLKEKIRTNAPYDQVVAEMLTAEGKLWHNGATGYLLRDSGMQLDNLANTLTIFLGTDVSCAQCHNHPFAEWSQLQFYELAAFFGATTTQMGREDFTNGNPTPRLVQETVAIMEKNGVDPNRYRNTVSNLLGANRYVVKDLPSNRLRLPHDYNLEYDNGKPGEPVTPRLIHWSGDDVENPAYLAVNASTSPEDAGTVNTQNTEELRKTFAKWLTHKDNPRFAMTIANRLWAHVMGIGLTPSVRNIDDPNDSFNPELLNHLSSEMVRVNFNLKEFMRIVLNSKAYQREATTAAVAMGDAYYFQGPLLRRMSAEQAWDSFMTLVLDDPDRYKNNEADLYGRSIDMNLNTVDAQTVLQKVNAIQTIAQKQRQNLGGGLAMAGNETPKKEEAPRGRRSNTVVMAEDQMMMEAEPAKILQFENLQLMRASELLQPAPPGHFLREFGQSERVLIDGASKEGSVPQVLMMMNGKVIEMLTSPDSLIFRNMNKVPSPADKVEAMFLTILGRQPTLREKDIAKRQLGSNGEAGYANMIWALVNTREFCFIQ